MFKTPHWFSFIAAVKVRFGHLNLSFWLLFRISDLEFRIYPLISQKIPSHTPCVQQSHLWVKISFERGGRGDLRINPIEQTRRSFKT